MGTLFFFFMVKVTSLRLENPWLILLLPFGGLFIIGAYHLLHDEKDSGTDLVLSSIHSGDRLPVRMAPLIFISPLSLTYWEDLSDGRAPLCNYVLFWRPARNLFIKCNSRLYCRLRSENSLLSALCALVSVVFCIAVRPLQSLPKPENHVFKV